MNHPEWIHVVAFKEGERARHLSFRLTRKGRVNMHDVNSQLRGSGYKVPIRYTDYGIRTLNPDVGWPEEYLYTGDPPEACTWLYAKYPEELQKLRETILEHHPKKMTPDEKKWIGDLESRIMRGTNTEEDLTARQKFLDEIALRPIDIDEW